MTSLRKRLLLPLLLWPALSFCQLLDSTALFSVPVYGNWEEALKNPVSVLFILILPKFGVSVVSPNTASCSGSFGLSDFASLTDAVNL